MVQRARERESEQLKIDWTMDLNALFTQHPPEGIGRTINAQAIFISLRCVRFH